MGDFWWNGFQEDGSHELMIRHPVEIVLSLLLGPVGFGGDGGLLWNSKTFGMVAYPRSKIFIHENETCKVLYKFPLHFSPILI
jgi:hypothetical protein